MYSIVCADDNKRWLDALLEALNMQHEFDVVATACDGKTAIEYIEKLRPDIILLDIIMPEYDGVFIVNHIRTKIEGYDPIIYILSGIGTDTIVSILCELDIDYYNLKPITVDTIITNLKNIISCKKKDTIITPAPSNNTQTIEELVEDVLLGLGLYNNVMYTLFIREAIINYIENPDSNRMLTKNLYPTIAKKYNTTASAVEKNIRTGVIHMEKENSHLYQKIFPFASKGKRVTNSLLLSMVSSYITKNYAINNNLG